MENDTAPTVVTPEPPSTGELLDAIRGRTRLRRPSWSSGDPDLDLTPFARRAMAHGLIAGLAVAGLAGRGVEGLPDLGALLAMVGAG